jgi:hypothetical protein
MLASSTGEAREKQDDRQDLSSAGKIGLPATSVILCFLFSYYHSISLAFDIFSVRRFFTRISIVSRL